MNKYKDGSIQKSDVLWLLQNHIREIQIADEANTPCIPQLYAVMDKIGEMEVQEAYWLRDTDGAWKCSHCGYRFFNGTGRWPQYCTGCGFEMKG